VRSILVFAVGCLAVSLAGGFAHGQGVASKNSSLSIAAFTRFAVFPVEFQGERGTRIDKATADRLDETWWQVREELADTGRFLVATKAFLQKADVFSPRGLLSTADAVILGRYVEADAIMTLRLENRELSLYVWAASDGSLAWRSQIELHPSILIRDQVAKVAKGMVREFVAAIPYHGVTLKDQLARSAIFEERGKKFARVQVGGGTDGAEDGAGDGTKAGSAIVPGQTVQWIELQKSGLEPLFQGGAKPVVKAEGTIREVTDRVAKVEIHRALDMTAIREGALLAIPAEAQRLLKLSSLKGGAEKSSVDSAVVTLLATGEKGQALEPEGRRAERERDETGALATTLSILGSLAVILLLAF
jgi:hypothetical protein